MVSVQINLKQNLRLLEDHPGLEDIFAAGVSLYEALKLRGVRLTNASETSQLKAIPIQPSRYARQNDAPPTEEQ